MPGGGRGEDGGGGILLWGTDAGKPEREGEPPAGRQAGHAGGHSGGQARQGMETVGGRAEHLNQLHYIADADCSQARDGVARVDID